MGCRDSLGPYWSKSGQGPVNFSEGLRTRGKRPINRGGSGGPGPDQGKGPLSDGQCESASGPRRSTRPRCSSRRQQWEEAKYQKAGRDDKSTNDLRPNFSRGHKGRIGKSLVDLPVQGGPEAI